MSARAHARCGYARTAWWMLVIVLLAPSARSEEARLGPIVRVSGAVESMLWPWAHAEPGDAQHLMACGSLSYPNRREVHAFVYASADSGATWHLTLIDDSTRWVSEVSCTYGENGHAFIADGESDTTTGEPRHEWGSMQLFSSDDYGMTWMRAARRAGGFLDWTYLASVPPKAEQSSVLAIFANGGADQPGHWWKKAPVALIATNGARTLSDLNAPQRHSVGNFAGGSVVLPDRTALFIAGSMAQGRANARARLQVFAVSPSDGQLHARAVVRTVQGHNFGLGPALVRDEGTGRFHGRLYAAWEEHRPTGAGELWLATSDDEGYHWLSRPLLPVAKTRARACLNDRTLPSLINIAVNSAGTLGLLWSIDAQTVYFSVSPDGGATVQDRQQVARHDNGKLSAEAGVAFNEWSYAEEVAWKKGQSWQSLKQYVDQSGLGLSVRLSEPEGISYVALAADAKGRFHAFWTGLDPQGIHALMTRTIETVDRNPGTDTVLGQSVAQGVCAESVDALHPLMPRPPPRLALARQRDVSQAINLQVERFDYDIVSHVVTVDLVLINKRSRALRGPLSLVGLGVHSDYGVPVALNASGEQEGQPIWETAPVISADGLHPKASSQPLHLEFRLDQFHTVPLPGDAVAMGVRVMQGTRSVAADELRGGLRGK